MKNCRQVFSIFKSGFTLAEVLITLVIVGVIAALTIPTVISTYRKSVVESRLKASFSNLSNAVNRSVVDNGSIVLWDYSDYENFTNKYILPYVKNAKGNCVQQYVLNTPSCNFYLADGTIWNISQKGTKFMQVMVDVNGDAKPNKNGHDRFYFHIFPTAKSIYNAGDGDVAHNVEGPGVYYDGYGIAGSTLINSPYRGCSNDCSYGSCMAHCAAIIAQNSWKIPDNYPVKY